MTADLKLKTKQGTWETPRNIALLATALAAIFGVLGFKLGQTPQQPMFPPGTVITIPPR